LDGGDHSGRASSTSLFTLFIARMAIGFGEGRDSDGDARRFSTGRPQTKRRLRAGLTHAFARLSIALTPP